MSQANIDLRRAAKRGDTTAIQMALKRGADIESCDKSGWTPLHWAAVSGHVQATRLLLENGANPNARGLNDQTVLHRVADYGLTRIGRLLIEQRRSDEGWPTADEEWPTLIEVIRLLLAHGADVNALDRNGNTALHHVLHCGPVHYVEEAVCLLFKADANACVKNKNGGTPLHGAAYHGYTQIADWLLKRGVDVNAKALHGYTALHLAALNGHLETICLLLEHGADTSLRDEEGRTAWDLAKTPAIRTLIAAHILEKRLEKPLADVPAQKTVLPEIAL